MTRSWIVCLMLLGGAVQACADDQSTTLCEPLSCRTPPVPRCEGATRITFEALGTCTDDAGIIECDYPEQARVDCAASGKLCDLGQCVDSPVVACNNVVCDTAPAPDCDGNVAQIRSSSGTCDPTIPPSGACVYPVEDTLDCTLSARVCRDGACIDPSTVPCDPNPCNVPPAATCNGMSPMKPAALGTCTPSGSTATCNYATTQGAACPAGRVCSAGTCALSVMPPAAPGDLVISEIMRNPFSDEDDEEWVELYNPSDVARELMGCVLKDQGSDSHTIATSFVIGARAYAVLGRSDDAQINGGWTADYVYSGFQLANSADEVVIECSDTLIDQVAYTDTGWPFEPASAMNLTNTRVNATANDVASNWCDATSLYGPGFNKGTPRQRNILCQ